MTKRQLRDRRRKARLAQRLRKFPHWTKTKIVTLLLKRPDHSMYVREILDAFGVVLPGPYMTPSRLFESVRDVLLHLAATDQIMVPDSDVAANPIVRLTATTWLKHARGQMDKAQLVQA